MAQTEDGLPWSVRVDFSGDTADHEFSAWREEIGRRFLRFDFQPLDDGPVHVKTQMHAFPNAVVGVCSTTPMEYRRTNDLIRDGASDIVLILPAATPLKQGTRSALVDVDAGNLGLWDISVPSFARISELGEYHALRLDRERLRAFCPDIDDRIRDVILRLPDAGRLLQRYISLVTAPGYDFDAAARVVIGQHIVDLATLALGATGEVAHEAQKRGWRAARLEDIKADITSLLHDPSLSIHFVAERHKASDRYLQVLFEESGTTFTEFVLEQRLKLAHRMLCDVANYDRKVSDIAHSAGFGDLSYFHRAFRRRFGDTPTGVRVAVIRRK